MFEGSAEKIIDFFSNNYSYNSKNVAKYKDLKPFAKNSASDASLFIATNQLTGVNVFLKKVNIPNDKSKKLGENWRGLVYEAYVYYVVMKACQSNKTYQNHLVVPDGFIYQPGELTIATNYTKGDTSLFGLITKLCILDSNEDALLFKQIMFDFLYGVYILNDKVGVIHNDLHLDNARFIESSESYVETYNIGTKTFKMKKAYYVKLYDFDQSTVYNSSYGEIENEYVEIFCKKYGSCNYKTKKDIFTIFTCLLSIYQSNMCSKKIKNVINTILHLIIKDAKLFELVVKLQKSNDEYAWSRFCDIKENSENELSLVTCPSHQFDNINIMTILADFCNEFKEIFEF